MDLANTPILPRQLHSSDHSGGRIEGVRLLTPEQSASPSFLLEWQKLAEHASEPNPFFEPWFLHASFEQFASDSSCTLLAVYEGSSLIGLLPIARGQPYYGYPLPHLTTWLHDNAFCGTPLIASGFERAFWRTMLNHLDRTPGFALFLHLPQLPADGSVNAALDAVLAEFNRFSATVESWERAMLASDAKPEVYLTESMSAKKRKELRRQHKRLSEEGDLTVERSHGSDDVTAWISDFLALEAAGWKGDAGSALANARNTRALFTSAIIGAAEAGRLERITLRLDGRAIAMLANFVTAPGVFSFKTTFDESYARFSPGLLLQIENLELLARPDIGWADSCASPDHSMIERIWREKRRIVSRNVAIGGNLRRLAFSALMAYETRGRGSSPL